MVYPPEDGTGTNRARRALTSFMRRTPLTTAATPPTGSCDTANSFKARLDKFWLHQKLDLTSTLTWLEPQTGQNGQKLAQFDVLDRS